MTEKLFIFRFLMIYLVMDNNEVIDASVVRMGEHLSKLTGLYVEVCRGSGETGDFVEEDLELDQLMRMGEYEDVPITPNYEYFGLQLKNIGFAMKTVAQRLENQAEAYKKATPFEMEPSLHTGETNQKIFLMSKTFCFENFKYNF